MNKGNNTYSLEIVAIKTKDKVFVADNKNLDSYGDGNLDRYKFDNETPKKTYSKKWFEVKQLPEKITRKLPQREVNKRYELKESHLDTGLPKVLQRKDFYEGEKYESVYGLYELKFETEDGGIEEVPFTITILDELDNFQITKREFDIRNTLVDIIQYHPILLSTRPCYTTPEESYRIIRNHIKENINPKYASVSSDYDFCFSVVKVIAHDPESYRVNVGKRKPKYETRYNRSRTVKVFSMAPKSYQDYPVIHKFTGKNEEDLNNNINTYLNELMENINKPYVECEQCKGMGVVLDEV